ncbi:TetR/AcrR family transcriptional regulator [Rhodopseudomonas palustris]|uniref:TetR/AcrR family transcriptional regulator n=2 Tax=Rhodopseudomonas TaxID=1073 RepID=UPI000695E7F4|nr:TetR/AcrR family transcriptional regulator [Rhodopseudomonas palustris]
MPTKTNRPRKIPRQARSRATVEVILDATALLLVDEGFEQTTTNRIAERAGVSIGSLYQYFPNREAVVGAVAQRVEAGISEPLWLGLSQKHESDLRSEITLGLRKSINRHASVLPLLQILLQLDSLPTESAPTHRKRQIILSNCLNAHGDELRKDFDVEAGSFVIPNMIGPVIDAAIMLRPATLTNGELERELSSMLSYYLIGGR